MTRKQASGEATTLETPPAALQEQWCVVSGGSKGIGKSIALKLLEGGANVVLVARNQGNLDLARAEAQSQLRHGQQVLAISADVSRPESNAALFAELRQRIPRLDHFVVNAGTGFVRPLLDIEDDDIDVTVALNLTGAIRCIRDAARMMTEHPVTNASILVVSSIRGLSSIPGRLIYAATKAGINQAAKTAAVELAPKGIRVNILSPGITDTPLTSQYPESFAEALANVPMGRPGSPADMAEAAYFLCTPQAGFITGLNMIVDGGESLS